MFIDYQMKDFIPIIISSIAIVLTVVNFWYSFYRKRALKFVCSSFTGVGMRIKTDNTIGTSFAIKLDVINEGAVPQVLNDLIIKANYEGEKEMYYYQPVVLWSFTEHIRAIDCKMVGNSQQGQISLPKLINPKSYFSFEHHILFLPLDEGKLIMARSEKNIYLEVHAQMEGSENYKLIGGQQFKSVDFRELANGSFSSVVSDKSKIHRKRFITLTTNSPS